MSDTTQDHAATSRSEQIFEAYRQYMHDPRKGPYDVDAFFSAVDPLFDALAAELAEANARAERFESLVLINWGVNGTGDITPAMQRTLDYARTGEANGEIDPWPHIDGDLDAAPGDTKETP